jgi:hypothetical protein
MPPQQAGIRAEAVILRDLATKADLQRPLDNQTQRTTVRVGAMLAGGFGIMTAISGLLIRLQ